MREPTVCVKALRPPFFSAAVKTGLAIPVLAARFDLPPALLTDLSARVPHATVVRVWDGLAAQCEDSGFGLTTAGVLGPPQVDLVDFVLQRSASVRALTSSLVRYQRLFHEANDVRLVEGGDELVVEHRFAGDLPRSRHLIEFILAMWVARLRSLLSAEQLAPLRICFRHAAAVAPTRYRALLGERVDFGAAIDALSLPRALMDQPLAAPDPATTRAFEAHLQEELARLPSTSYPEAVRAQIVALMRAGSSDAFDIERIARRLAVSRRTLQRRLLDEHTSFRDVIDAARRDVALEELSRGASTVTDLAFLLGFSEHSAFSRAFRRWTGKSPALYVRNRRIDREPAVPRGPSSRSSRPRSRS